MGKLSEFKFMDLYVRLDAPDTPRYRSLRLDQNNKWSQPLPGEFHADAQKIINLLRTADNDNPDTAFDYDNMHFRISRQKMASGEEWVALRRINPRVPKLEELGYAPHIANYLRNIGRRDGLILFSGATGHGKTTSCFSLLQEYLKTYGGVGMTVEEPVEYMLEGPFGDQGYCYQIEVGNEEDWATPLKRCLRWTPRYMLVGEIRSPAAAEQILRAATTGHLVLTTIHAGSIEDSLMGLLHLAHRTLGDSAKNMLAQALTAAVHQVLNPTGPFIRYVFTEEANNGDPVRALIREDRIGMINTYIDRQVARMQQLEKPVTPAAMPGKKVR
ncbi:MAG TPA: ATPase, T2SS/T4P/T4SS family [Alphaproteobacteria bacterium]|nr:ATPase, T2SS/T4P/T4SS family [Alphaproteobacteria bacterium]